MNNNLPILRGRTKDLTTSRKGRDGTELARNRPLDFRRGLGPARRSATHVEVLCEQIGPRWASSEGERQAVEYLREQFAQAGLADAALEEFALNTWAYNRAEATVGDMEIDLLPYNRCPPCNLEAPIVNAGYGTEHEVARVRSQLKGSIAVMHLALEPFTSPSPPNVRLEALCDAGAVALVAIDPKDGRRVEYHNGGDWREPETAELPIPAVTTSREHGALLQKWASEGKRLKLTVESRFYQASAHNVVASIPGTQWPEERLMLGGHHDTVVRRHRGATTMPRAPLQCWKRRGS